MVTKMLHAYISVTVVDRPIGETGAQWLRNLLFQYITYPVRATGIF